jgi:hypothetical protein
MESSAHLSDVFKLLIDRADLTLEEATNVSHTNRENLAIFWEEGDSVVAHLPPYRHAEMTNTTPPKKRVLCDGGCGRLTTRRFPLYPLVGPLCRYCERTRPEYRTIDYTTARRRFYLKREDLEGVPAILRYMASGVRCRYFRPADLLAVALRRHGGQEGMRARREKGLKRREAALRGLKGRRERLESQRNAIAVGSIADEMLVCIQYEFGMNSV